MYKQPLRNITGNMMSRKRVISASGALGVLGTALATTPTAASTTNNASLALLWGATGEQEWTPALTTGFTHYKHLFPTVET